MKVDKKITKGILVALLSLFIYQGAKAEPTTETIVSKTLALDTTQYWDMGDYDRFSMQAVYSTAAFTQSSIRNGSPSSANITVSNYHHLDGRPSTATVTLTAGMNSYAGPLVGQYVTVNGRRLTEAVDWTRGMSSTATMKSLQTAIGNTFEYSSSVSSNVITLQSVSSGTAANAFTLTTSSASVLPVVNFAGGQNFGYVHIGGVTLTEGTDFNAETSNAVTAENIENAIQANSTLAAIIIATHPIVTSVVYATSTTNGVFRYAISVSTPALTVSGFSGGSDNDIDLTNNQFSETSHGFVTGLAVLFSTSASNIGAPGGLTNQTTYFVMKVDDNTYKVGTTAVMVSSGGAIDLTSQSTATLNYTFTALPTVGAPTAFKWQASNNGVNWTDLSITTVTTANIVTGGGSIWDFSEYAYRYLRLLLLAPTSGATTVNITQHGQK